MSSASEYVASLSTRAMLKEVLDWLGYDRVALVATPELELPLAVLGQLQLWLDGQPMPAIVEARLRALLQIVLILEPKGGLIYALEVLDQPMATAEVRLLLVLAIADLDVIADVLAGVSDADSER